MTEHRTMVSRISARRLCELAEQYETAAFLDGDPSQFMHRYEDAADIEVVGLIAASLAFGRRSEILRHIEAVLSCMGGMSPSQWLLERRYETAWPDSDESFYRIFSYRALKELFSGMALMLSSHGSIGACLEASWRRGECAARPGRLATVLADHFPRSCSPLIAFGERSANKRLNLFLRWMVRGHSPVDMGLWTWYPRTELLMPLDVHVAAVAKAFGFLPETAGATLSSAVALTDAMKRIFPKDPVKGDFALFGYGLSDEFRRHTEYKQQKDKT